MGYGLQWSISRLHCKPRYVAVRYADDFDLQDYLKPLINAPREMNTLNVIRMLLRDTETDEVQVSEFQKMGIGKQS
jgi:hypothetical protein